MVHLQSSLFREFNRFVHSSTMFKTVYLIVTGYYHGLNKILERKLIRDT